MVSYNNEIREANKKLWAIKREKIRTARTVQFKHRNELENIQNKLIKDNDREAENMEILSSRPFFKDLKALKQSFTSPVSLPDFKSNHKPYKSITKEKRHSFKDARTPQIKLLGIDGQHQAMNKQLSAWIKSKNFSILTFRFCKQ
jgi:hypothetical protein